MLFVFFGYGLLFGSFVNALVWRLHERAARKNPKTKQKAVPSVFRGRSMCPECRHVLGVKDLIPVLSWFSLRGKCRYCRKSIPVQYPIVELLTGVLFVVFYLGWPFSLSGLNLVWFLYGLVYMVFFVALAVYDFKWFLLPDKLVFPLIALAASEVLLSSLWLNDWHAFWLPVLGATLFFGLLWALYEYSKGRWIGGGDVKLALALGLIAGGPLEAMMVLFVASLLGTIVSIPLLLGQNKGLQQHIPFGPYLLAGCLMVVLYGERMVRWYTGLFL